MEHESRAGTVAWLTIGAFVVAWDLLAPETLSHAYERTRNDRLARAATLLGTAAVVGHLTGVIPDRYDLLHRVFEHMPHNAEK